MKSLGINWFIEGSIDFEYKKYILLDYLQEINRHFDKSKLYPNLTDLIFHYNNLLYFKKNKSMLQQAFPQRLTQADIAAVKLTYQKIVDDDSSMREIEQIIAYALQKMDPAIQTGKEIYGQQRIKPGAYSASPVLADGKLYVTNEEGLTTVIKAGPKFEVIAENELNDYCLSSPAISDGQIFIRTATQLHCIGSK